MTSALRVIVTTAVLAAVAVGIAWIGTRAMRNARKGSHGAAAIGWALLFFGFGMAPPPTPQQQVEDTNRVRKNERTGNDTLDDDDDPPARAP
jgi:hypothetical protein